MVFGSPGHQPLPADVFEGEPEEFRRIRKADMNAFHEWIMLKEFGPSIYSADGPSVSFFGFPYPTRMAVVRLSNGSAWVWSPVALSDDLVEGMVEGRALRAGVKRDGLHDVLCR